MPFVALRARTGRVLARTSDAIDLARLLLTWTQLGGDAALVSTFESRGAASSWLTILPPPLPKWAIGTCLSPADEDVIVLEGDANVFPVFALLRKEGGQLGAEGNPALVPRLVNTIKALNGEVVIVRMLSSMSDAEKWLQNPRLPTWLSAPAPVVSSLAASRDDVVMVTATTVNGIVNLTDSEGAEEDIEAAAQSAFRRAARALPPPRRSSAPYCHWRASRTPCSCRSSAGARPLSRVQLVRTVRVLLWTTSACRRPLAHRNSPHKPVEAAKPATAGRRGALLGTPSPSPRGTNLRRAHLFPRALRPPMGARPRSCGLRSPCLTTWRACPRLFCGARWGSSLLEVGGWARRGFSARLRTITAILMLAAERGYTCWHLPA